MAGDELQLIEWLRAQRQPNVALGIGDDMAVVSVNGPLICVSSDMMLDGVHFDTEHQPLDAIGRKAIAAALSDCAAMAVRPTALTVSLALPKAMPLGRVKTLFAGMFDIAGGFGVAIVGGDTTRWNHPLAIDVTVTACPHSGIAPVTRSGAKPGDTICVTGQLGGSRLGHHLTFMPRVDEARHLAETLGEALHAMIDITDGLSLDLWRLCVASNTGATLDEGELDKIISPDARLAAEKDGRSPLDHVLNDGEDFELLLAIGPAAAASPPHRIGTITREGLLLRCANGSTTTIEPRGFVH